MCNLLLQRAIATTIMLFILTFNNAADSYSQTPNVSIIYSYFKLFFYCMTYKYVSLSLSLLKYIADSEHHMDPGNYMKIDPTEFNNLLEKFLKHRLNEKQKQHQQQQKHFEKGMFHFGKSVDDADTNEASTSRLNDLYKSRAKHFQQPTHQQLQSGEVKCDELPDDEKASRLSLLYLKYVSFLQQMFVKKYLGKELPPFIRHEDLQPTNFSHIVDKLECNFDRYNMSLINYR